MSALERQPSGTNSVTRTILGMCILATPLLTLLHLAHVLDRSSLSDAPLLLTAALIGFLGADLLTGSVHWACDTWGDEESRFFGTHLIKAFRAHHRDPEAMTQHDWIGVNQQGALPASLALALLFWPFQASVGETVDTRATLLRVFAACFIGMAAMTNQFHQWAHQQKPARAVRWLQSAGLILSPARHALHHCRKHDQAYCVSTGWMNPLLDGLGWWRALERGVVSLTGALPQRGDGPAGGLGFTGEFTGGRRQDAAGGLVGGESHEGSARPRLVQRRGR